MSPCVTEVWPLGMSLQSIGSGQQQEDLVPVAVSALSAVAVSAATPPGYQDQTCASRVFSKLMLGHWAMLGCSFFTLKLNSIDLRGNSQETMVFAL